MTQSQLIQHISVFDQPIRITRLRAELKQQSFTLQELVDLTFYHNKEVAVKASRLLETMLLKFPQNYCNEMKYLIQRSGEIKLNSCKKHYAKIISHLTSPDVPKDVRDKIKEINFEPVVEFCFDWMIDPEMLISVRGSASEVLFNLRHRYPWIAADLSNNLEYMMRGATPLLLAKGNLILSYLHCED